MAKGWSFEALTAALKDGAFYSQLDIINLLHPVGSVLMFNEAVNPNTLFPGTTWVQNVTGRCVRQATSNVVGTAAGQISSGAGSDTVSIAAWNLPAHTHTIATHSHTMAHTHTMWHTHSTPNHTHSGTANSAGSHVHNNPAASRITGSAGGSGSSGNIKQVVTYTSAGQTDSQGDHTHSVTVASGGGGTTGGASNDTTSASSAASTGTDGPTATGSVGSGTALDVTNSSVYHAFWIRTA